MATLPTFRGWTIDERLREFRKGDPTHGLRFVPFDSPEGQRLSARIRAASKQQEQA